MNVTGSPVKLNSPNAMNATTAMTATDWRMRRMMKASTDCGCDVRWMVVDRLAAPADDA